MLPIKKPTLKINSDITPDPFFIYYVARSGSTFLANLMIKRLQCAIPPESNLVRQVLSVYKRPTIQSNSDCKKFVEAVFEDVKFQDWNISRSNLLSLLKPFPISNLEALQNIFMTYKKINFPKATRFGIKKGALLKNHSRIIKLFPNAPIIGLIRDGRAAFNSQKKTIHSRTGKPIFDDPHRSAEVWCHYRNVLRKIQINHSHVVIIKYEDLIINLEKCLQQISKLLNIDLLPATPIESNRTSSYKIPHRYSNIHDNIDNSPMVDRLEAWKNELTQKEISIFESVASQDLKSENYL